MNNNFTEKLLQKIDTGRIQPRPRWHFLLKYSFIWTLAFVATAFGALAMTTIIFIERDYDWDVLAQLDNGLAAQIFISLPYLWVVLLALFMGVAWYYMRHTRHGYRYDLPRMLLLSVVGSIILGGVLYIAGVDNELHDLLVEEVPWYERVVYTNSDLWASPERGLLSGRIIQPVVTTSSFLLTDGQGRAWLIQTDPQTEWEGWLQLATGTQVKLMGSEDGAGVFYATEIRPWRRSH